ncbi:MAG: adenylate/guanylate cyclase domain-containing protein [Spirulina sp. SIO3F2]|nr:adenylate/guanylate cyclase domain-containing protein [Spirulina sp. SIO3F2]
MSRIRSLLFPWRGISLAATLATVAVLGVRYLGLLQGLEWAAYDHFLRWRSPPNLPPDERIKIVTIDEEDLHAGGQALISDRALARALRNLSTQNPLVIGLDLYRDLPVPPGQAELSKVLRETPNIVGIQKVAPPTVAPPVALAAAGRAKANDLVLDGDGRMRRGFLFLPDNKGQVLDAFSPYLALWWLEDQDIRFESLPGDRWRLGAATFEKFGAFDGGYIRAHDGGYQLLINYRGPGQQFEQIPFREVVRGKLPPDWAKGKIVLIGATAESLNDRFTTPLSGYGSIRPPIPLSGVEVNAHITAQVIDAALGDRPLIKPIPESAEILWVLLWSVLGATSVWHWRLGIQIQSLQRSLRLWVQQLFWPAGLLSVLIGSTYVALLAWGLWVPVVPAILSLLVASMGITLHTASQAAQLRQTFGRYLTNEVVTNLLEQPGGLNLGGVRQTVTILTSDIRGFTALAEHLSPEEVITVLNLYLKAMLQVIADYQGTINAIMGDGLLVFFGVPTPQADDAERAIACALAMQLAMTQVNQELDDRGFPALAIGIGINTGECVVGNLGSELHTEYSAVGAQVNLAFRIESYTTSQQIFVSETVLENVDRQQVRIDAAHEVNLKGVKDTLSVYEVGGINGNYQLELPRVEEQFVYLPEPLALLYVPLEGKSVSEQFLKGHLVELSTQGAKILGQAKTIQPQPFTDLKLNLLNQALELSGDIYAKVRDLGEETTGRAFWVDFTAKPPAITAWFLQMVVRLSKEQ